MVTKQQSGTKRTPTPILGPVVRGLQEEKRPPLEIAAEENSVLGSQIFIKERGWRGHFEKKTVMCYELEGNGGGFSG